MRKLFFLLFAFGAMMVSCEEAETNDAHDEDMKGDQQVITDTVKDQQTTADTTVVPGMLISEVKEKNEKSASCFYNGMYNIETGPTNGSPALASPQRIGGWRDKCPLRTSLTDGSVWTKATPDGCVCN